MLRALVVLGVALAVWCAAAPVVLAADAVESIWPSTGAFNRGSGHYLSPWKVFGVWLLFLCWVRSTDWISQDSQQLKLRWTMWNSIAFSSFFVTLLLFWIIPNFWIGLVLLLISWIAPLATYATYRNKQVLSPSDKVFTNRHLKRWVAQKANSIGIKMAGGDIDPRELGPDIQFTAQGGANDQATQANQITARQSPGFLPSRELINDALLQRASHVMLDYSPQSVGVRYQIDGLWHDRSSLERMVADPVLEVFKGMAGLKVAERRARQSGKFLMTVNKVKYTVRLTSQGTQTGERALLQFDSQKAPFKTLDDIGMRTKMQETLQELFKQNGLFVFCSMPAGGLTKTIDQVLSHTDRYTRNYVEVMEETKPERDIENVHPTTYSAAAGETPATVLPKLIRTYPDVIVIRDVSDVETLSILCEQAGENRLTVTSVRAKEAVEALLRLMMLKIPAAEFAPAVVGVLNTRLVRKLCEKCKEGYPPPAEVLKQLGLPAGRIEALYRTPTVPIDPKKPDKVCDACNGLGYVGRTGIFELLLVDDSIRKVLTTAPKLENLRLVARKAKHRTLQEEGVLMVARGVTSIQELLRVLKQ